VWFVLDPSLVLTGAAPAFALLHRATAPGVVDVFTVGNGTRSRLADVPLPDLSQPDGPDVLVLVPYRQLTERGLDCHDDGTPLLALPVLESARIPLARALSELPDQPAELVDAGFDLDDEEYRRVVRTVVADEIGRGAGSNFVIRRRFTGRVVNHSPATALAIFRRLLERERGAYWTFIVHCGDRTLVGASPERHVSLDRGVAAMTPISGTYRHPTQGATVDGLLRFLADGKESDELAMVVDEELKMMGAVCPAGARVAGPQLRVMARLTHTEYTISGQTTVDPRDLLRATLFAPTVTGSPLVNACRVIKRHERGGRGYYGGVIGLFGHEAGARTLDSAILIRTAHIDAAGRLEIGVGSTLVRHSDPAAEAAETEAKLATLHAALTGDADAHPATARSATLRRPLPIGAPCMHVGANRVPLHAGDGRDRAEARTSSPREQRRPATTDGGPMEVDPRIRAALAARNDRLASFWFEDPGERAAHHDPRLVGRRVVILDAEDGFTAMLATQVRSLGPQVTVIPWPEDPAALDPDLVLIGPGPGDPTSRTDKRIRALRATAVELLTRRVPLVAVCLGHQVLAGLFGLPLRPLSPPSQGQAREIELAGESWRMGFYNTFVAISDQAMLTCPYTGEPVTVLRSEATGEVFGLRRTGVRSVQFHLESVLSTDGPALLHDLLTAAQLVPAR
jgi:phenazine biosynthesis protein phzE